MRSINEKKSSLEGFFHFYSRRQDENGKGSGNGSFQFGVTESSRARGRKSYRVHPPAGGEQ